MRRLICNFVLCISLVTPSACLAQPAGQTTKDSTASPTPITTQNGLTATNQQDRSGLIWDTKDQKRILELNDSLDLKATGSVRTRILDEIAKDGGADSIVLVLRGITMAGLHAVRSDCSSKVEVALCLHFDLTRNSQDAEQRTAWNALLTKRNATVFALEPRLAIGIGTAISAEGSPRFCVASSGFIWWTGIVCVVLLCVSYWLLLRHKTVLRNPGTSVYSLGKSQVAFWTMLVLASFIGVYVVTGSIEFLPAQVLVLIGLSAGTGLSAAVIGTGDDVPKLQKAAADAQAKLNANNANQLTAEQKQDFDEKIQARDKVMNSVGFVSDICNDGDGFSFHRLQVCLWTIVLGIVFARQVISILSMPEFPETLLALLGISHGTYLGYKLKEREPDPNAANP